MTYNKTERIKKDAKNIFSQIGKITKFIAFTLVILLIIAGLFKVSGFNISELAERPLCIDRFGVEFYISYVDVLKYGVFIFCIVLVFISDERMNDGVKFSKKAVNHLEELTSKFKSNSNSRELFLQENGQLIKQIKEGVFLKNSNEKDTENIVIACIDSYSKNHSLNDVKSSASPFLEYQSDKLSEHFSFSRFSQGVLPLIGFAGTIVGIMIAMHILAGVINTSVNSNKLTNTSIESSETPLTSQDQGFCEAREQEIINSSKGGGIESVILKLSLAFDTTLVAILCSLIIKWLELRRLRRFRKNLLNREKALELNLYKKMHF